MSREIKFRAWYKDGYIKQISLKNEENMYFSPYDLFQIEPEIRRDVVLEQYTGLKDKNGKEIYEGDIVKGKMGVFEVRWYDAIASFCFKPNTEMKWRPNFNQGTTYYMEIVGNIHENPELLEVQYE